MAKSYVSQGNKSDGTERRALKGDLRFAQQRLRSAPLGASYRPQNRPQNLVFYLVTSILLHSVLFLGSDYWLRAFALKQELSKPIPIEYVEVPPNKTKTPPKTSQRAAIDSVAGGKAKPKRPISAAKSASTIAPKTSKTSEPSEALEPERTQQKTVSSN
ncbi:MAG: hypothetical protein ACRDEA_13505, partial [Microcystaceae cyanobacterium]